MAKTIANMVLEFALLYQAANNCAGSINVIIIPKSIVSFVQGWQSLFYGNIQRLLQNLLVSIPATVKPTTMPAFLLLHEI